MIVEGSVVIIKTDGNPLHRPSCMQDAKAHLGGSPDMGPDSRPELAFCMLAIQGLTGQAQLQVAQLQLALISHWFSDNSHGHCWHRQVHY